MKFAKYILITAVAALAGCLGDKSAMCPDTPATGATATIRLALPQTVAGNVTRSGLDDLKQYAESVTSTITELDLLVIDQGNVIYNFEINELQLERTSDYITFKIDLPYVYNPGTKITLIANSHKFVEEAFIHCAQHGSRSEALFMEGLHNIINNELGDFVPMWGETGDLGGLHGGNIPTIQMIRSLALGIVIADPVLDDIFVMTTSTYVNANAKYLIAPWNGNGGYNYSHAERKVTAPSIPDDVFQRPTGYVVNEQDWEYGNMLTLSFADQENTSSEQELAIVIGAYYGPPNNGPDAIEKPHKYRTLGYYKVLFRDKDGNRMDVLRNHCYTITIKDVTGPGFNTWQEAVESHTYVQAVVEWNDAPQNVVFDGQYFLEVSHTELNLFAEAGNVTMTFKTDFPGGEGIVNFPSGVDWYWVEWPSWITAYTQAYTQVSDTYEKQVKLVWSNIGTGAPRSAAIRVTAGNMNYVINITQSTESWLTADFTVAPLDGLFHKVPVSSRLDWEVKASGESPDALDKFKQATYSSAESKDGVFFHTPNSTDGTYRRIVLTFTNKEYNYEQIQSEVYIGPIRGEANCYIVKPNDIVLFPVSIANQTTLGDLIDPNDELNWKVIWQDKQGVKPSSNIAEVRVFGKGPGAYMFVKTGSATGNAVIAVTSPRKASRSGSPEEEVVRWSWHIWVTDYDPDNIVNQKTFMSQQKFQVTTMNRNLGALRSNPGTPANTADWKLMRGLYYQWGRKDAFPLDVPIWSDAADAQIDAGDIGTSSMESIMYPLRPSRASLWNGFDGNGSSWGYYDQKSVHDPCPEGWKVPAYDYWGRNNTDTDNTGDTKNNLSNLGARYGAVNGNANSWWLDWPEYGGYFPAQSRRTVNGTDYSISSQTTGYLWAAQEAGSYMRFIFSFSYNGSIVNNSGVVNGYQGAPVRCVKEWRINV